MNSAQLRQAYLDFLTQKIDQLHAVIPSAPLLPENDPSTLFTSSGMQPLVPYLLGQPHPLGQRLVNSQKSFRAQDIEEVGDNRHTTFFEMLGNWSLGAYFKKEQLRWFFTFLTQEVGLNPHRLFVTVFAGNDQLSIPRDDESVQIWHTLFLEQGIEAKAVEQADQKGMQGGRIFFYNEKKNWWSRSGVPSAMPAGEPGGPDSEVFFDFGEERQLHENSPFKNEPCHVNCDCGRFMEIGNSVFMQYQKQADQTFKELPQRNVDFGGGLERILAAKAENPDVFATDFFHGVISVLEEATQRSYTDPAVQSAMRIIADHFRAAVMLVHEGVLPSNKQQGYVLRRLIRRAGVKLHQLQGKIDGSLVEPLCAALLEPYREVDVRLGFGLDQVDVTVIAGVLRKELDKFAATLERGLRQITKTDNQELTEQFAFDLFQSAGFPYEITAELFAQRGKQLSRDTFDQIFAKHQQLSRSASAGTFKGGLADHSEITTKYHTATHLLHAALRQILGKHVQQKGSNITAERLRFDFIHPKPLSSEEVKQVENQINDWVQADLPVTREVLAKQVALDAGAIAFFVEKYPEQVSVYTIGHDTKTDWISKEFCGGPHVQHTGEIGQLRIAKEQSAAAGIRRIYMELVKHT